MLESVSLQPDHTLPWREALSLALADQPRLPVAILDTLWDPATVPAAALPHLARAQSVDLYRPEWSAVKKRQVTADSPTLHRLKGSIEGIRRHLAINDARLVEWKAPPEGVFLSSDVSKAEMEAWYARLPQIRVYTIPETAPAGDELYFDDGCFDDPAEPCFLLPDLGPTLSPRKATYWHDGVETSLRTTRLLELEAKRPYTTIERVEVPTPPGEALFFDDGCLDDVHGGFFDPDDSPVIVTYALDRTYSATLSAFATTTVVPALQPVSVRAERVSLTEPAGDELYFDDGCFDDVQRAYLGGPYDGHLAFDRLCYDDPAIAAPVAPAISFWDVDRYDMEDFRLEILVDVPGTVPDETAVYDLDFLDDVAGLAPHDPTPEEDAAEAARAGKAHRDQVLMTLATFRPRTFDDGWALDGSTTWDEPVPNTL